MIFKICTWFCRILYNLKGEIYMLSAWIVLTKVYLILLIWYKLCTENIIAYLDIYKIPFTQLSNWVFAYEARDNYPKHKTRFSGERKVRECLLKSPSVWLLSYLYDHVVQLQVYIIYITSFLWCTERNPTETLWHLSSYK